jgi:hypothetical protein
MTRRYRNFDQLRSVVAKEAKNRPFCLAYAPGDTRLDVYWSDAVRRSGEPHDAAVNCIQALHAGRSSAYRLGIVVYRAGDYWGYMPQGMLEFVGDFKGDPGAAINATIEVNLEKCEKRTEALPQFNPAGLGPAPNVDLKVEARTGQRGSERAVHRLVQQMGIMAAGPAPAFGAQLALVAEDFFNSLKPEDWDSIDKVSNERQMNL